MLNFITLMALPDNFELDSCVARMFPRPRKCAICEFPHKGRNGSLLQFFNPFTSLKTLQAVHRKIIFSLRRFSARTHQTASIIPNHWSQFVDPARRVETNTKILFSSPMMDNAICSYSDARSCVQGLFTRSTGKLAEFQLFAPACLTVPSPLWPRHSRYWA